MLSEVGWVASAFVLGDIQITDAALWHGGHPLNPAVQDVYEVQQFQQVVHLGGCSSKICYADSIH